LVAKSRERLAVNKQEAQMFEMDRKLSEPGVRETVSD
jgi:hypothetical protein